MIEVSHNHKKVSKLGGQALVEYLLMLLIVVGLSRIVLRFLPESIKSIEKKYTENYTASYQYGDQTVSGGDGGYQRHPRAPGQGNFRMFRRLQ